MDEDKYREICVYKEDYQIVTRLMKWFKTKGDIADTMHAIIKEACKDIPVMEWDTRLDPLAIDDQATDPSELNRLYRI